MRAAALDASLRRKLADRWSGQKSRMQSRHEVEVEV
jgi:hypothetical protein